MFYSSLAIVLHDKKVSCYIDVNTKRQRNKGIKQMATLTLKKKKTLTLKKIASPMATDKNITPGAETNKTKKSKFKRTIGEKTKELNKILCKEYPVWRNFLPLRIGVDKVLLSRFRKKGYNYTVIRSLLKTHLSDVRYLNNVLWGGNRYALGGQTNGVIYEKGRIHALKQISVITCKVDL